MARPRAAVQTRHSYFSKNYQLYLMLLVPVLYFVCFKYLPMFGTIIAFKDYNMFQGIFASPWVGLKHFKEAFASQDFWIAIKNTLILNLGDLIIGFPIPILLAVGLNELIGERIKKISQTIMYLPYFLSWVIISGIMFQIFSGTGLVNNFLAAFGFTPVDFLSDPQKWRVIYWIIGVWHASGYSLVIYLAALTGVDPTLYEASYIDGASRLQRIWFVTIPMIRSTITMMLIMNLGKVMAIGFERPYMLGNVLVKDVSNVISTHVYSLGLQSGRFDFATAIGLFQSVVGVILVLVSNKMAQKFGEEGII